MKPAFPEPNLARSDLKRKGKEKVTEPAKSETRWRDGMHGVAFCDGTCQPGPCCMLFPRLPDGKVVLPDPLQLLMKPDVHSAMPPPIEYKRKAEHRLEGNGMPKEAGNNPASRSHRVENYAQLSSLPEFKAFRMDHDNGENHARTSTTSRQSTRQQSQSTRPQATTATERRKSASQSSSSSPKAATNVDLEWQQWKMREIRVVKRRRKQEYIRSGTHDFSIRLWSKYDA